MNILKPLVLLTSLMLAGTAQAVPSDKAKCIAGAIKALAQAYSAVYNEAAAACKAADTNGADATTVVTPEVIDAESAAGARLARVAATANDKFDRLDDQFGEACSTALPDEPITAEDLIDAANSFAADNCTVAPPP